MYVNYSIEVPFLITYEFISGAAETDYMNYVTVAHEGLKYSNTPQAQYFSWQNKRQHRHDYFELLYVVEGSIIQKIENNRYYYTAGTGTLLNRNVYHSEESGGYCKLLFVGISPELVRELSRTLANGTKEERGFIDSSLFQFMVDNLGETQEKGYLDLFPAFRERSDADNLREIAEQMLSAALFRECGFTYVLKGLICSLLGLLSNAENYHITRVNLASQPDFLLFSRITYLLEESDGRLSRRELERILNYSGNYLNRIVHKYANMNLFDYSMSMCMKKAAWLLLHTDSSVTEIMEELKFSNSNHFYAQFKKQYGVTPAKYRASH